MTPLKVQPLQELSMKKFIGIQESVEKDIVNLILKLYSFNEDPEAKDFDMVSGGKYSLARR